LSPLSKEDALHESVAATLQQFQSDLESLTAHLTSLRREFESLTARATSLQRELEKTEALVARCQTNVHPLLKLKAGDTLAESEVTSLLQSISELSREIGHVIPKDKTPQS
jgi:septation ring formation regulator EzrA